MIRDFQDSPGSCTFKIMTLLNIIRTLGDCARLIEVKQGPMRANPCAYSVPIAQIEQRG